MTICILDTSIFCNILRVPGRDQEHRRVLDLHQGYLESGHALLLPLAVIFETGNHIAGLANGQLRRHHAEVFSSQVVGSFEGRSPWTPTPRADIGEIKDWIGRFPEMAMRGVSLGDLSIIKVFEAQCDLNRGRHVFIWSLDQHLQGFDREV